MDNFMTSPALNYRPASVYRKRDFFQIHFYWRANPLLPFQRFKNTFDLNRIPDIEARAFAADLMAESVTEALKTGWDPNTGLVNGVAQEPSNDILKKYLPEALKAAAKSVVSKSKKLRTHSSYKSHLKLFTEYLERKKKYRIQPDQFTRLDAQLYQDHLLSTGLAPKTINTKFDYAAGLFRWMKNTGIVPDDPFALIDRLQEPEIDEEDALFTPEELTRIKGHLLATFPELWQYFLFIYYCMMRPDSIMAIQCRDIDLKNATLTVYPENHKNSKKAYKQLLEAQVVYLQPWLDSLQLEPEDFLFSNGMMPGKKKIAPTRAAEAWKKHVKDVLHIYKNAYYGKHTSGTAYVEENPGTENLKWLQMQMSHSDLQTTSIYVNKKKKVKLDESKSNIRKL
jgi:integrase